MTEMYFCKTCYQDLIENNLELFNELLVITEIYLENEKPLKAKKIYFEQSCEMELSECYEMLENSGFIITHEDDQYFHLLPLWYKKRDDGTNFFCKKNHLQDA